VYGAKVLRDVDGTSEGAVVGYLDNAQCLVDFDVHAPASGAYLLKIRYSNRTGGQGAAAHALTVNGTALAAVRYPPDPSSQWRDVTMEIGLRAGRNTLRLAHGEGFAEIDYIEVS
jgi:hypothetical protein